VTKTVTVQSSENKTTRRNEQAENIARAIVNTATIKTTTNREKSSYTFKTERNVFVNNTN